MAIYTWKEPLEYQVHAEALSTTLRRRCDVGREPAWRQGRDSRQTGGGSNHFFPLSLWGTWDYWPTSRMNSQRWSGGVMGMQLDVLFGYVVDRQHIGLLDESSCFRRGNRAARRGATVFLSLLTQNGATGKDFYSLLSCILLLVLVQLLSSISLLFCPSSPPFVNM